MLRLLLIIPRLVLLLALPLMLMPSPARSVDPKPIPGAPATAPGPTIYLRGATAGAAFLIEVNRLALQKSSSAALRQLAEKVARDQEKILALLARQDEAGTTDVKPDPATAARQEEMLARLRTVPTPEFDQAFLTIELKGLQDSIQLHESYREAGGNAALRAAADEAASLLQQDLSDAAKIARSLGTQT